MKTGDTPILPTLKNRITANLHAHGIDLMPREYIVRQARYMRRLARQGFDAETLAATSTFLDQHPQLMLGAELGPASQTQ